MALFEAITGSDIVDRSGGAFNVGGSPEAARQQREYLAAQQSQYNGQVGAFTGSQGGANQPMIREQTGQAFAQAGQAGQAVQSAMGAAPAPVTNPYIGRTNADTVAAQQVQRQGQQAALATGQLLGGVAGARAAAYQNSGAQVEASRTQQILQAQERQAQAQAYNQAQATGNAYQLGQGQLGVASQGQGQQLGLGLLSLDQQRQLAEAQLAGSQSQNYLAAGQNLEGMQLQAQGAKLNAELGARQRGVALGTEAVKGAASLAAGGF